MCFYYLNIKELIAADAHTCWPAYVGGCAWGACVVCAYMHTCTRACILWHTHTPMLTPMHPYIHLLTTPLQREREREREREMQMSCLKSSTAVRDTYRYTHTYTSWQHQYRERERDANFLPNVITQQQFGTPMDTHIHTPIDNTNTHTHTHTHTNAKKTNYPDAKVLAKVINSSSGRSWSSDTYNPCPQV